MEQLILSASPQPSLASPEPTGTSWDGADFSQGDAGSGSGFREEKKATTSHHWDGERSEAGVKPAAVKRARS